MSARERTRTMYLCSPKCLLENVHVPAEKRVDARFEMPAEKRSSAFWRCLVPAGMLGSS